MNYLQAFILSIVEGITEFLPISSTGHLILTTELLQIQQTEFVKNFEIFIQLGAICAIVFLYWKTFLQNKRVWERIIIAMIPTTVIGYILYKIVKELLLGNTIITLYALLVGGILLVILELLYKEQKHHVDTIEEIGYKKAFFIGVFQSFAMVPGVSRAAATIIGGLFLGAKRKAAVEFSFLLAVPTMLGATSLDIAKSNFSFSPYEVSLLAVGFLGSFVVALLTVKFFLGFIKHHTFLSFGIYRIIVSILFFLLILR